MEVIVEVAGAVAIVEDLGDEGVAADLGAVPALSVNAAFHPRPNSNRNLKSTSPVKS